MSLKILFEGRDVDELTIQPLEDGDVLLSIVGGEIKKSFRVKAEDVTEEVFNK